MRIISKVAATAVLVFTLFPAVAANAQVDCARADYCNPDTPDLGGSDAGTDTNDGTTGQPGGVSAGGPAAGGATSGGGVAVLGAESEAPAAAVAGESRAAAATAPSGALPITGSDVVGIAALGAVAIGLGTLLVKRSRAVGQPA